MAVLAEHRARSRVRELTQLRAGGGTAAAASSPLTLGAKHRAAAAATSALASAAAALAPAAGATATPSRDKSGTTALAGLVSATLLRPTGVCYLAGKLNAGMPGLRPHPQVAYDGSDSDGSDSDDSDDTPWGLPPNEADTLEVKSKRKRDD